MLARANRVVHAAEFRQTIRRGRKWVGESMIVSLYPTAQDSPVRFGFVISKSVGNAVVRNRVRRRMRAAAFELLKSGLTGTDIVIRALPAAHACTVAECETALRVAIGRS